VAEQRIPAEVFPPGEYIADELKARGWTTADLARRMGGDNPGMDQLAIDLLIAVHDKNLILDEQTAFGLGRAFGTSARLWINLDRMWRGLPSLDSN